MKGIIINKKTIEKNLFSEFSKNDILLAYLQDGGLLIEEYNNPIFITPKSFIFINNIYVNKKFLLVKQYPGIAKVITLNIFVGDDKVDNQYANIFMDIIKIITNCSIQMKILNNVNLEYTEIIDFFECLENADYVETQIITLGILKYLQKSVFEEDKLSNLSDPLFFSIIKYINLNLDKDTSLKKIADMHFCSERTIQRMFTIYLNQSYSYYLNSQKINLIKKQLLDDKMGLLEIAKITGFSSQQSLSNFFKKETGMSPNRFKNEIV